MKRIAICFVNICKHSSVQLNGFCQSRFVLWIFLTMLIVTVYGEIPLPDEDREHVCQSIDVRNDASLLSQLEDCTVIEGSLTIVLIDHGKWPDYLPHSYPKLVEITDYLLIFRVNGLRSLSHIFPNLTVIRGYNLFVNYALVIYETQDIEELGLPGLTSIHRGAIRLEMNPKLCYIETIDWNRITNVKDEDNFIYENGRIDECANVCEGKCPKADIKENGIMRQQPLCWDYEHCQIYCPSRCGPCGCYKSHGTGKQECCHEFCLGGCYGPESTQCIACKNVMYKGRCQPKCPLYTYKYLQRRCISEDQCRNLNDKVEKIHWKLLSGAEAECARECPSGFTESKEDHNRCIKCEGKCPKVCQGLSVDSVAAAQKLRGCTIIHGILEIHIRGGSQVGLELERSLGSIQEVDDYIVINHSAAITSLRFFKNLRLIHGTNLKKHSYALFVLENHNLQDIWDFDTHPNLTISQGKVFFHFNRKLCMNKIQKLIDSTGLTDQIQDLDVSRETNGDQVACNLTTLPLEFTPISSSIVFLHWENFHTKDYRELLNWVVNYREAPVRNITMYNARDACGTDVWKTDDVRPIKDKNAIKMAHILTSLKPYTQYAVYVKTYTVSSATKGAMSGIVYFRTLASEPSEARDIKVVRSKDRELHISWKPPKNPNGNVTHYVVYWQALAPKNPKKYEHRNYCVDRLQNYNKSKPGEVDKKDQNKPSKTNMTDCCASCSNDKKTDDGEAVSEDNRIFQMQFQDKLQNVIYRLRVTPVGSSGMFKRKKRNVRSNHSLPTTNGDYSATKPPKLNIPHVLANDASYGNVNDSMYNESDVENGFDDEETRTPLEYTYAIVLKTETIIPDLHHFQEYSIEIIACQDYGKLDQPGHCSNRAIASARTLSDPSKDAINHHNITVEKIVLSNGTSVHIRWKEPEDPNGLTVTYDIEIRGIGTENLKPYTYCISHSKYKEIGGFKLTELVPGNWSYKIRSTSLAGYGPWTTEKYFSIEGLSMSEGSWGLIAGFITVAVVVLLAFIVVICAVFYLKKKTRLPDQSALYASINPDYWGTSEVYVPDEWEVERDKVDLIHELGQGSFGMVYEGIAKGLNGIPKQNVAIKTVTQTASIKDRIEFLNEASVMKAFNCTHVVKLLGVVSVGQPTLVIMELMANGDLKTFLRLHRPDYEGNDGHKPPTLSRILQMAGEIADGMNYLSAKKFVHRDLAARNCMVSTANVVKIGDFGMTRDIYETDYYRKGGKGLLPVRWMAPESLRDGVFSTQSDVWSYGVVLWEMATLAAQPYQGFANEQVLKYVVDGNVMEKPENCPDRLYEMMDNCWKYNPRQRYTFNEIIEQLVPDLDESFRDVSFFFSDLNQENLEASRNSGHEVVDADEEAVDIGVTTPLTGSPLHKAGMCYAEDYGSDGDISSAGDIDMEDASGSIHSSHEADLDSSHSTLSYDSHNKITPFGDSPHQNNQNCPVPPLAVLSPFSQEKQYGECPQQQRGRAGVQIGNTNSYCNSVIKGIHDPPDSSVNVIKENSDGSVSVATTHNLFQNSDNTQKSPDTNSNPPSLPHSNEGSKGSSKSGTSSNGINGIANGHIPRRIVPNPQC